MQRGRGSNQDPFQRGDPFSIFQGFGVHRSSLFGGRDPFDDPFFTRPFNSGSGSLGDGVNGVLIEELDSDHEDGSDNVRIDSSNLPLVQHPDDNDEVDERRNQNVNQTIYHNKVGMPQSRSQSQSQSQSQSRSVSFQTSRVTYGGVDGTYYTSTSNKRTGSDGVVLEESREADKTTGQATHKISRGINGKGHSVIRKLDSGGKVDTKQTLHNLNEDELMDFEQEWKGSNSADHLPGWADGFNMHGSTHEEREGSEGWMLPSLQQTGGAARRAYSEPNTNPNGGGSKKVVRINID